MWSGAPARRLGRKQDIDPFARARRHRGCRPRSSTAPQAPGCARRSRPRSHRNPGRSRGCDRGPCRPSLCPRAEVALQKSTAKYFASMNSRMPVTPPSRPRPLCLTPPNGAAGSDIRPRFSADHAGLDRLADPQRAREVGRVDIGRKPVFGVVGEPDRLRPRSRSGRPRRRGRRSPHARSAASVGTFSSTVGG